MTATFTNSVLRARRWLSCKWRSPIFRVFVFVVTLCLYFAAMAPFLLFALSISASAAPVEAKFSAVDDKIYVRVTDASGVTKCSVSPVSVVRSTLEAVSLGTLTMDGWLPLANYSTLSPLDNQICFEGITQPPPPPPPPALVDTQWVWFTNKEPTNYCTGPILSEYPGGAIRKVVMNGVSVGMAACAK